MKNKRKKLHALQVVTLDPIINLSLSKTIKNYKGFVGIHILPNKNEPFPVILLFDSPLNRNEAYKKINNIKDGDKSEPNNIIVAIILQPVYVD